MLYIIFFGKCNMFNLWMKFIVLGVNKMYVYFIGCCFVWNCLIENFRFKLWLVCGMNMWNFFVLYFVYKMYGNDIYMLYYCGY